MWYVSLNLVVLIKIKTFDLVQFEIAHNAVLVMLGIINRHFDVKMKTPTVYFISLAC